MCGAPYIVLVATQGPIGGSPRPAVLHQYPRAKGTSVRIVGPLLHREIRGYLAERGESVCVHSVSTPLLAQVLVHAPTPLVALVLAHPHPPKCLNSVSTLIRGR